MHASLKIRGLTAGLLHKFVDDTTLSEFIRKGQLTELSNTKRILVDVCHWSRDNCMNINRNKTKEMLLGTVLNDVNTELICLDSHHVQRVPVFKLLEVTVDSKLKWNTHIDNIWAKASSRLYTLNFLKPCSLSRDKLWHFYVTAIRPLLEYACPAWHTSLNQEHSRRLENIQKPVLCIWSYSNSKPLFHSCGHKAK